MKYIYVVNRFTFKDRTDEVIRVLKAASEAFHRDCAVVVNETVGDAAAMRERFRDTEYVITAVGGDGSLHQLLNELIGTKNILALVPLGTGNDFYRYCAANMDNGVHEVDLIQVNDRWSINTVCFGIDADIANDDSFIHNRFIPRPLRFHAGVLYHFLTWKKGRRLKVECGEETIEQDFTTVVAANGWYYGSGYKVSPGGRVDDGLMDVYLVDALGKINMARTILSIKNAGHLQNPAVRHLQARRITVSSGQPFKANLDGEPCLHDRFELEMRPAGIRFDFHREFCEYVRHGLSRAFR